MEYLFGESLGLLSNNVSSLALALNEALDYALEGVIYRLRLGKLMPFHSDPKFWAACKTVHAFADQYVARALELRKLEDVLDYYVSPLTYEALEEMKYLKWVVAETLCLFPLIANNGRMAVCDTVFPVGGGLDGQSLLLVTKGTLVLFSTYVMQRWTDLWGPDAEDFKPKRWSPELERKGCYGWEYLLFLGGLRVCPGQKFALTQTSHVLARLAKAFERVENMDLTEWREQWTLSVAPKDGVKVKMVLAA
ncbi:Cytochrome P450 52E1 [Colletotrichum tanaceti]|uniref:Cytochrome P450 52E1 n=1 Tax=Colletotrichum tanaceti TaxID=1306861 RepID=A0A4U6XGN5_9PEZI|nr:Cytochrome P450 52E1 [Colletotrichum tanaceti]TKW54673.1 Cytochrome P450 52E1 [Colletotrichum tanaceti]